MESYRKKMYYSSTSTRLLWIMVPFILVSIFFAFGNNSKTSTSLFSSSSSWLFSSVLKKSSGGEQPDFQPKVVAVAVAGNGGANREEALLEDYSFNSSNSFSPLTAESDQEVQKEAQELQEIQQPVIQKNESFNIISYDKPHEFPSLNETHALPIETRIKRKFSNLERLEAKLGKFRAAIKEAATSGNQTDDADYIPSGPMYWNANAFHRSYLEMEKQFKVFVYEEGDQPIFHNGPCKSIYAMEGNFIYQMETTKFRTRDPEKAHIFFLPISVTAIVHFIYDRNSKEHWNPMKQTLRDYINLVAGKYPYWNRSLGADHFMLACHDWGPEISKAVPELFKNSIRALCNANTSEGFKPSKDVSFPEILLPGGTMDGLIGGPSPSHRSILAFFAGGLHGPIRPILLEHWENKDDDIQVHRYLPKGVSYYGMLRKSKYCLCPSGYEVASPRMVEALYTGCVPVLIKDHYVLPFSDVLNWKSFSVEVLVEEIPNLKKILAGISTRQYIRLQRRGKQVRRHFEVNMPPKRYDVFHMILHSIWLRRLNMRIRGVEYL
ncbi:putative glycosyltransferase At5g03795 isoform X2 [Nicotiana tabacum]|uniref:Glycosyltransferase At5g03795 isoform X2 n=1 Tax=Nicotiana tabacum TaxID=4097 RepID=A0A1S4AVJ7_TOBAC|nr:probable glycosyltransferase At5g03795 isoform X2 [Nicotiana tomentosiformis]XP_016480626.1 PREDICTED: probable glycosyltransferase At5g03795 isoform X2 [Nicotiana tabacum]